jgi:hypothetical protein
MISKKFKKYIEVFMWCLLIFGVAFPSLRFQQLTIERSEADARRMSTVKSASKNIQYVRSSDRRIRFVHNYDTIAYPDSSVFGEKIWNSTSMVHAPLRTPYKSTIDLGDLNNVIRSLDTELSYDAGASLTTPDWPLLDNLIEKTSKRIISDVQFILDFAIIAHPKTATSNLQTWFRSHPEIQMHETENHALAKGSPAELVSDLYNLKPGWSYKRGYKAPRDLIISESLHAIEMYWPTTKLIVGLRHPVLWFESFYNFRVHNGHTMPPPETLIGKLKRGMVGVATDESKFHLHLDNLGKTLHSSEELKLLSWGNEKKVDVPKMRNPVFLYEVNQLRDTNETRAAIFSADLRDYLALTNDFQPMSTKRGPTYSKAIEICESKYKDLRRDLMKNSREASTWIRKYFLKSPDVTVSSPDYFNALLVSWMTDPCDIS